MTLTGKFLGEDNVEVHQECLLATNDDVSVFRGEGFFSLDFQCVEVCSVVMETLIKVTVKLSCL